MIGSVPLISRMPLNKNNIIEMIIPISRWYHGFIIGKIPMFRTLINRTSLLFRFSIISLLVILLVAAGFAWRLESTLESDILQEVAQNTAAQASTILDRNL